MDDSLTRIWVSLEQPLDMLPLVEAELLEDAVTLSRIDRLPIIAELVPRFGIVGNGIELVGAGQIP